MGFVSVTDDSRMKENGIFHICVLHFWKEKGNHFAQAVL